MSSGKNPADTRQAVRRLGLFALLLVLAWSTLTVYAVHAALPHNPIRLPFTDTVNFAQLLPEGWKFFTRDAREERAVAFMLDAGGQWKPALIGPNFQPRHLFGLDRKARAQGAEMGLLIHDSGKASHEECRGGVDACLGKAPVAMTLKNGSLGPTLCGQVGLVFQKPVPWAWSQSAQTRPIVMPSRVLRLEVQC